VGSAIFLTSNEFDESIIGIALEFVEGTRTKFQTAEYEDEGLLIAASCYSMNAFIQKTLPPAFSNSEVSSNTGIRLS
jgi:hypothetical protein